MGIRTKPKLIFLVNFSVVVLNKTKSRRDSFFEKKKKE